MDEPNRSKRKQPTCRATRKDGQPCTAPALASGYCYAHDDARAHEREEARRKGGRNKAHGARVDRLVPASLRPVLSALLAALSEVHDGALAPQAASAMASLAGAIVKTYSTGVMEERLGALEAAQAATDGARGAA